MDTVKLSRALASAMKSHKEVIAAYLYGSVAKVTENGQSDIDIGLLFQKGFKPDAFYETDIAAEIEKAAGLPGKVDARVLNGASLIFVHQVLRYGRLLFCRDDKARAEFEMRAYKLYLDYKPFFESYNVARGRRLKA